MTEEEIVNKLNSNRGDHNKALGFLFRSSRYKDPIIAYLRSNGVQNIDIDELWTDIVVKFAMLVRDNKYQHQGKLGGYLKNLARYIMLNHFRDQDKIIVKQITPEVEKDLYVEATTLHHKELKALLDNKMSELGSKCQKILSLWSMSFSMDEIMKEVRVVSVEATRKRKHKCLKSLLENINSNSAFKDLLKMYH